MLPQLSRRTAHRLCTDPPALFVLQIVVDSLWFMDILITFRTAYYDKATLVSSPGTVARRYLTSWFLLDMIATFPVYAFSEQEAATKLSRVVRLPRLFKVVRILRLVRVLRLQRFSAYVHHIEAIFSSNVALLRLVKFACVTIIMQHWISCGWFLMADLGAFAPETWVFRYVQCQPAHSSRCGRCPSVDRAPRAEVTLPLGPGGSAALSPNGPAPASEAAMQRCWTCSDAPPSSEASLQLSAPQWPSMTPLRCTSTGSTLPLARSLLWALAVRDGCLPLALLR